MSTKGSQTNLKLYFQVLDFKGQRISSQIAPIFEHGASMSLSKYRLSFVATVPAFGLVTYIIKALEEDETPKRVFMTFRAYIFLLKTITVKRYFLM